MPYIIRLARTAVLLLLILFVLLSEAGTAFAQSGNVSISVSANVISSIEYITIRSIDLTQAEAEDQQISVDPSRGSNAGKMIAEGSPNSKISISFQQIQELSHDEDGPPLLFNYRVAGNTKDDQSTAELLQQDNREFRFNENGEFYLWIGGDVDISAAFPGNYSGAFTVDMEYL